MKILVYPKDTNNPYQYLLYKNVPNGTRITYFTFPTKSKFLGLILFFPKIVMYRIKGYTIFHIHWLYELGYVFSNPFLSFLSQCFFFLYSLFFILTLKVLGFKIVWTVHNIATHEKQTLNDIFISRVLAKVANTVLVNSDDTLALLAKNAIKNNSIHVLPIGNYIGIYKNTTDKNESRRKLKIKKPGITFLYFGQIRQYKGIDLLLNTFIKLREQYPDTNLIIAGKSNEDDLANTITKQAVNFPENIFFHNHFIPNEDIQYYFNASDVVVFPFKKLTTTSSALLALAFKKPIIYPNIANLKDFPENIGIHYDAEENSGLKKAMVLAVLEEKKLIEMGQKGYEYTYQFSWKDITQKLIEIYQSL